MCEVCDMRAMAHEDPEDDYQELDFEDIEDDDAEDNDTI